MKDWAFTPNEQERLGGWFVPKPEEFVPPGAEPRNREHGTRRAGRRQGSKKDGRILLAANPLAPASRPWTQPEPLQRGHRDRAVSPPVLGLLLELSLSEAGRLLPHLRFGAIGASAMGALGLERPREDGG